MPRTSKNKFEIINDEIHISKEGWPLIGLTTYREDYYEELTSKTWTLTKANSETDDKGYLSNKTLGLLHRYIVAKWYGQDVLDTMTQKGFVVDHLNNNHTDCRISNLEFLKKAYNTAKGQAFDVDSKMMEHHIAVNIFKDFSTGYGGVDGGLLAEFSEPENFIGNLVVGFFALGFPDKLLLQGHQLLVDVLNGSGL